MPLTAASPPPAFATVLSWADDIRKGHLAVRANADTGDDAANARKLGAEGIGLCRTEHMFLGEDRLPVVRRMILAHSPAEEAAALEELRLVQREDFIAILAAMDGLPVTVRLLDPPLHEFLPSHRGAGAQGRHGRAQPRGAAPLRGRAVLEGGQPDARARGACASAVIKPGLYAMQVRALMEAARQRVADGGHPIVEIMIPLTVTREELALARGWVEDAVAEVNKEPAPRPSRGAKAGRGQAGQLEVTIGTMIETPRAALRAGEIAEVADFFSFGTNDLTQMTFGFSRDDVEGRMMDAYLELGLLPRNPFEVVDFDGVGELVRLGTERGRATRPSLKVGRLRRARGRSGLHRPLLSRPGSTTSAARRSGSPWPAWPPPRRCWPRVGGGREGAPEQGQLGRLATAGESEAPERDQGPDGLDDPEGPGAREEAVGAREGAAQRKGQDEPPAAGLQGIHAHHEGQGADAVDGDRHRATVGQNGAGQRRGTVRAWGYRTRKWPRSGRPPTSSP